LLLQADVLILTITFPLCGCILIYLKKCSILRYINIILRRTRDSCVAFPGFLQTLRLLLRKIRNFESACLTLFTYNQRYLKRSSDLSKYFHQVSFIDRCFSLKNIFLELISIGYGYLKIICPYTTYMYIYGIIRYIFDNTSENINIRR